MSKRGLLYYITCQMLFAVLQLYYGLYDEIGSHTITARSRKWISRLEESAGSLNEEIISFIFKYENTPVSQQYRLESFCEERSTAVFLEALSTILAASRSAQDTHGGEYEIHAYYHYCHYLLAVLAEFNRVMNEPVFVDTVYHLRYQGDKPIFDDLAKLLQADVSGTRFRQAAITDMALVTQQLAKSWHDAIYSSLTDFKAD